MHRYLIVEDEPEVASVLEEVIESGGGRCLYAPDGKTALEFIEGYGIDIALVDIKLPDMSGLELINSLQRLTPDTVIIVITSVYETQTVVSAIKSGASEYITKPFEIAYLQKVLSTYQELVSLRKSASVLLDTDNDPLNEIIGESDVMQALKKTIQEVSKIDSTVLLTGPTGVGKAVIAKAIHRLSPRRNAQFVKFDCAAIPQNLLETELFGYNKGAFTGADKEKKGLVERADGGSLFIDELGELPINLQVKLLGFLDTKEFRRVGGLRERKSDLRLIAATNRSLEEMVKRGDFREDLFYRLNVIHIAVPPLKERGKDIWLMAEYFLKHFSKKIGRPMDGFREDAMRFIMNYSWPGNVRELMNLIERAVALSDDRWVSMKDLAVPLSTARDCRFFPKDIIPLREMEREYIRYVLESTNQNKSLASRLLGITRKTLREKLSGPQKRKKTGQ